MHWTSKFSALVLICLQLFAVSCSKPAGSLPKGLAAACPSPSPLIVSNGKLKLFIPDEPDNGWVKYILDETTKQAAKAGLSDLKTTVFAETDLEMRFWVSSIDGLRGIVFKRNSNRWTVTQLEYVDYRGILNPIQPYPEPDFGWDVFWEKLVSEGILELPDGSCFKDYQSAMDGITVTVEVNIRGAYRIYEYFNPTLQTAENGVKDPHSIAAARQMTKILGLVLDVNRPRKSQ